MKNISRFIRRVFLDNIEQSLSRARSQGQLKNKSPQSLETKQIFKELQQQNKRIEKMTTIQEAERERQLLEEKVHELVDKLESKKAPNEIKVPKEAIIKSKAERDASAALEKLAIKEEEQKNPPAAGTTTSADTTTTTTTGGKKATEKSRGGKGAAPKEPVVGKPVDISRLDLRIGRIVEVDRHPDADALYVEKIDCGDSNGPRTVISGLVKHVPIEEMKDRLVVVLCNLKPAKMRGILSEAMVMCASTPDKVELLKPPEQAKPGDRVVFEKYPGEPDSQLNPKKKIWEQVAPDIKTNQEGVAIYKDCEFRLASDLESKFTSNLKNVQIR